MSNGMRGFTYEIPELNETTDIRTLVRKIINYEEELQMFLQFKLNNLDARNLNPDKMPDISQAAIAPVAANANAALERIGDLAALLTSAKGNLTEALNEVYGIATTPPIFPPITYQPINYTAAGTSIDDHLAGIDAAIGALLPPEEG